MKTFTMMSFVDHLASMAAHVLLAEHAGLKKAAEIVEKEAKSEFGKYQGAIGSFAKWDELADSTKDDRVSKGFSENDPLLRTGEQRDAISHEVNGLTAAIGSPEDVMLWLELGTPTMPPRAVLGPALLRKEKAVVAILGAYTMTGLQVGSAFSHMPTIKEY